MPGRMWREDGVLKVSFAGYRGPDFMDLVAKVKTRPGRRYNPDDKTWELPGDDAQSAWELKHMIQPDVDAELDEWIKTERIKQEEEMTTPLAEDAELEIPWATRRTSWQPEYIEVAGEREPFQGLMKHQRPAVKLAADAGKMLVCDDMGGGKTGTAISAVEEWRLLNPLEDGSTPNGPKLVICPNSVKGTWENEIELWLPNDTPYQVIDGTTAKSRHNQLTQAIKDDSWVIVNWEQIRAQKRIVEIPRRDGSVTKKKMWLMKEPLFEVPHAALLGLSLDDLDWRAVERLVLERNRDTKGAVKRWLAVIGDEVHRAKNRNAQATRGLWRCRADEGIMLGLSGTPLMNDPAELWSILAWLWPGDYHERGTAHSPGARAYWTFFEEYVEYDEGYYGKVITGVKNPDALRFELSGRIIRRTKRMMRLGTKGKKRIPVPVKLNKGQRKLYDEAEKAMWLEVEQAIEKGDKAAERFAAGVVEGNTHVLKVPNGAARTVRLRQIIETPANLGAEDDSAVLDAMVDKVLDSRPEQWIVFTEFKPTVDCAVERLNKASTKAHPIRSEAYHGDVDPERRRELGRLFQAGEVDVLVGTMKSMREGITLTAGFNQFWVSRDWVPDNNEQGEDRMDRIGQTKQVLVWIAQPEDTVAVSKVEPTNRVKERIVRTILPKDEIEEA